MRIEFRRAGGFAGRVTRLHVDLEQLTDDERAELERLVAESGCFSTDATVPSTVSSFRSGRRDAFEYTIEIDDDGVRRRVTADDGAAPERLRALIDALVARTRPR